MVKKWHCYLGYNVLFVKRNTGDFIYGKFTIYVSLSIENVLVAQLFSIKQIFILPRHFWSYHEEISGGDTKSK